MIVAVTADKRRYHIPCARRTFGYQVVSLVTDTDIPDDDLHLLFSDRRQEYGICVGCGQPITKVQAFAYLNEQGWHWLVTTR